MVKNMKLKLIGLNIIFFIVSISIPIQGFSHVPKNVNYIFDVGGRVKIKHLKYPKKIDEYDIFSSAFPRPVEAVRGSVIGKNDRLILRGSSDVKVWCGKDEKIKEFNIFRKGFFGIHPYLVTNICKSPKWYVCSIYGIRTRPKPFNETSNEPRKSKKPEPIPYRYCS